MGKNLHVVPNKNKWGIKGEGNTKFTKLFDTRKSAIIYAKMIANRQKSDVVIHNNEGKIMDKDSNGIDPDYREDKRL